MARAIWTGSLSFGLVNVPVGLYSATADRTIHFNQFQAGTADRVRNKRVNERTGEEVTYQDIVKGFDLGAGEYVIVAPDELAALAPAASQTIAVSDFVDLADIDPIYFDRPYYLAPRGKGGDRAYALLLQAMAELQKVAVAQFIMREKQYLAAIRPGHDALVLETLRFADEVREPTAEIPTLPVQAEFDPKEIDMARLLIESMTSDWDPSRYHDSYREQVETLIEQKQRGEVVQVEPQSAAPAPVVDLLEALQKSVASARGAKSSGRSRAGGSGSSSSGTEPGTGRTPRAAPKTKRAPQKAGQTRALDGQGEVNGQGVNRQSKAELVRRASELNIEGRSKMTRDELAAAIEASAPRRKAS